MLTITDHGEEVRVIDGSFLCLGVADDSSFAENGGDREAEVGTKRVDDHRSADVRSLQSRINNIRNASVSTRPK